MKFQEIKTLLFTYLRARAIQDFLKKRNITISVDPKSKNFILDAKLFTSPRYLSPKMKDFAQNKSFPSECNTFLRVCNSTSDLYLTSHVPYNQKSLLWRKHLLDFTEHAKKAIEEITYIEERDAIF